MKEYRISKELAPHFIFVLNRELIPYEINNENGTYSVFKLNAGKRLFKVLWEDACCEMQRDSYISKTPVYSARTLKNKEKRLRLMELNGTTGFAIKRGDEKKAYQDYYYENPNELKNKN